MKQYVALYIAQYSVDVVVVTMLKFEDQAPDVFIVDELDYILENMPVSFDKYDDKEMLFGLGPVFHSKEAYFVAATYDKYHLKLLKDVFDIDSHEIVDQKSK